MESPRNSNYAAVVTSINTLIQLKGCDNVQAAILHNYSVIVSMDVQPGDLGLFFPAETALSHEFMAANNLYRKPEYGNVDPEQKGFFEQHGRVKTMKFRGHKSEAFWIPLSSLQYLDGKLSSGVINELTIEGVLFDKLDDHEICHKYVNRRNRAAGEPRTKQKTKSARLEDSIVDGQFRFHTDTENLRRNVHKILPNDLISITDKWHGTSVVIGKVLVKRHLGLVDRILCKLGINITQSIYGLAYSSRKVIKAVNGVNKASLHYYSSDIWGDVAKEVESKIPNGFTLYGEIVGFTSDGGAIQQGYAYGCGPNQHKLVVYRVTLTTPDGLVVELSWPQLEEFCLKYGLETVDEFFYGRASDLLSPHFTEDLEEWQANLLKFLEETYVEAVLRGTPLPHSTKANWILGRQ
jgi:hypothetical protein